MDNNNKNIKNSLFFGGGACSPGEIHDLVIVGGGPAGAAAAIQAMTGSAGRRRVVLLEGAQGPRFRPGEIMHPGIEPVLRQLGVWDMVLADALPNGHATGHWISRGDQTRFIPYGADPDGTAWRSLVIERARFDARLRERARTLGVEVRENCRAHALLLDPHTGRVGGVILADGTVLRAPWTIDATGGARLLGRALNLPMVTHSPRLVVRYGYARFPTGESGPTRAPHLRLFPVNSEQGGPRWEWIARVGPDRWQWARLWQSPRPALDDRLPDALCAAVPDGPVRGANATWRQTPACAGPGWMIAGDAGQTLDPSWGRGVLQALLSGIFAAHCAGSAIVSAGSGTSNAPVTPAAELRAASAFRDWTTTRFAVDCTGLAEQLDY